MYLLFKMVVFHCYVSLPKGTPFPVEMLVRFAYQDIDNYEDLAQVPLESEECVDRYLQWNWR